MKFYVLLLILLFGVANLKIVDCYKCNFRYDNYWGYTCEINPDSVIIEEKHLDEKTDDNVKNLKFEGNSSRHLTQSELSSACQRFKNLKEVEVSNVKSDNENLFQQCKNLVVIWIKNSKMEEISENLFSSQSSLSSINLGYNKLKTLPENIFSNQKELYELYLHENQISCLPPNIFKSLGKLELLYLNGNKIESLNPKWIESLQSLRDLELKNNKIQDLPKNVFAHLRNLEQLNLYDNQLTTIHSDSFGIHRKLEKIDLENNKINSIDEKFIDNTAVRWLYMSGNVCSNEEFLWVEKTEIKAKLRNCFSNYQPRVESRFSSSNTECTSSKQFKCGTRHFVKQLIHRGNVVERAEYPWNVALKTRTGGIFCGGTLVSDRHVVTAAHCIRGKHDSHVFGIRDFVVLLGVYNSLKTREFGRVQAEVSRIDVNVIWNIDVSSYDGDIAILKLRRKVNFSNIIQPICLVDENSEVNEAPNGTVVGYGFNENGTLSVFPNKLEIPIRKYHDCTSYSRDHHSYISYRTFCGGPADGRGVCSGDSGGGVYVIHDGQFYLRGLVSASLMNSYTQCDVSKEAIFTDVPQYYEWIKARMN